mgnify:CR=1 FL=1
MKFMSIPVAMLVAGALSAQGISSDLNARVIVFGESTQTAGILLGQGIKDQAGYQTGAGIRIMGQVAQDSPWFWELAGRFSSSARMVTNRDISSTPPANVLDVTKTKVQYSYWSIGAAYLLPLGTMVDLGCHLDGRGETINPKGEYSTTNGGTARIDAHTVYFRPWVRCSLTAKIKMGSLTTLFGGEAGLPLLSTTQKHIVPMSEIDTQTLRAMAPKWSGSFFAGVQF